MDDSNDEVGADAAMGGRRGIELASETGAKPPPPSYYAAAYGDAKAAVASTRVGAARQVRGTSPHGGGESKRPRRSLGGGGEWPRCSG